MRLTMYKTAFVLACLACVGHGRHLHFSTTARESLKAIGLALDTNSLAEARQSSTRANAQSTSSALRGTTPSAQLARLLRVVHSTPAFHAAVGARLQRMLLPIVAQGRVLSSPKILLSVSPALSANKDSIAEASSKVEDESLVVPTPVELSFWTALKGAFSSQTFRDFMTYVRRECGDSVFVNLWPMLPPMYVLMGKAANRGVLSELDPSLAQILQEFINLLPISARVPAEEDVLLQRKMAQLFSNTQIINKRLPVFRDIAERMRNSWVGDVSRGDAGRGSLNIFFELSEYVLRADLEVLYGRRFTERHAPQLVSRFADWVSNIANGQLVGFFEELGQHLRQAITDMQSNPDAYRGERSVLQVYLKAGAQARHDTDAIVGLLSMSLMAAVFNTQVSLAWILVHLYAEPELLARARKEIAECPDLNDFTALSELEFLNSCIDEAVRMHTTLPGNTVLRKTKHDLQLGEATVKEGSIIWLYPNAVHGDERYFPQAGKFCPMRLLSGNLERMNTEFEIVTFGHGQKRCVGEKMARAMILTFLATVLPTVSADAIDDLPDDDFFDLIPASKLRLHNLREPSRDSS
mmetsp:Transcript_115830/g.201091  ORF Transcript_115830/g.201091 Transcript_115830/m.201091 type:complete len:581 (-) Transcript_115830:50-1792(-)